jgi:TldD protein
MSMSRRQFVHRSASAALLGAAPRWFADGRSWYMPGTADDHARLAHQASTLDPNAVRALALRAVDAARSAGATYADVRLTRTVKQKFRFRDDHVTGGEIADAEDLAVGVRALVNGYWGFAASPYWDPDEMDQLAHTAAAMAKSNALGMPHQVELGTLASASGTWATPVRIDPFTIPIEEKIDLMNGWRQAINDAPKAGVVAQPVTSTMAFQRQERFMASTDGTYTAQTIYTTSGGFGIGIAPTDWRAREDGKGLNLGADHLGTQNKGWELLIDAKIHDQIPGLLEQGAELLKIGRRPVMIGRFDVVFDSASAGNLLSNTFGLATQLDRALGYEANATGTSYLGPKPLDLLGTTQVATPSITVTANRSTPGALATVKWDDEGVVPDEFTLIKDGTLVDYQTTREQAAWLAPWYRKQGTPVHSHGCASSQSALNFTLQRTPNLVLAPGKDSVSFADMIAGTKRGVAIFGGQATTDFQARNGWGTGTVRQITNGKLGPVLSYAGYLFNSTELWKNVTAIGGPASVTSTVDQHYKGQPASTSGFSISAVPLSVKDMSIIDTSRKA